MNHPQLSTPIAIDNTTTIGFFHNIMVMRTSNSWNINLYWLRYKEAQKYFDLLWEKGSGNKEGYFTKHHPTIHHRNQTSRYVRDVTNLPTHNIISVYKKYLQIII